MRQYRSPLLILLALLGCVCPKTSKAQETETKPETAAKQIPSDTSPTYIVFPYDTVSDWIFSRGGEPATGYRPTELSSEEIDSCYRLIAARIDGYNKVNQALYVRNYYYQYVAGISPAGEKMVYVSALCRGTVKSLAEVGSNWRERLILVDDGGSCFFQMLINLTRRRVVSLSVNGPG